MSCPFKVCWNGMTQMVRWGGGAWGMGVTVTDPFCVISALPTVTATYLHIRKCGHAKPAACGYR